MRSQPIARRTRLACALAFAIASGLSAVAVAAGPTGHAPLYPQAAPYAGYVNHAHTAPTFQWGWFGAERYAPHPRWHRDYNGNLMRWTSPRRY